VEELESYKAWCLFHPYRFHQVHFSNTFGQERNEQATKAAAAPWLIGEMPWCRHVLPASLRNFHVEFSGKRKETVPATWWARSEETRLINMLTWTPQPVTSP